MGVWLLVIIGVPVVGLVGLWLIGEQGHLILPSTLKAVRGEGDEKGDGGFLTMAHGYIYSTWAYEYIGVCIKYLFPALKRQSLRQLWADHYHGKVLPPELAKSIITLEHDIRRTDLEQIIPYPTARDIVLKGPPSVVVLECPCRAARENPCQPVDVCMIVGDGGGFALEHHPDKARAITQEEAIELLRAEHERGHVHIAYFKDACDHKFYALCNCCLCCCGGIEAMVRHDIPMVCSSGYVAQIDELLCSGCGDCEETCHFEAITVNGTANVDWEKCMGCGVCIGRCQTGAVELVLDERKGIPLDVQALAEQQAASAG